MSKYIIKNCPAIFYSGITPEPKCLQKWEQFDETCQGCTDCVMKQIVELCKDAKTECECYDTHLLCLGEKIFAEKILNLLDIQEVE